MTDARRLQVRSGFSTVELLLALTIGAIVATATLRLLSAQQRFFRNADATLAQRRALREGTAFLAEALRGFTTADTLGVYGDTALELRTVIGASIACAPASVADAAVILAPDSTTTGMPLSAWSTPPESGDEVLLLRSDGPPAWQRATVVDVTPASGACAASTLPSGTPVGPPSRMRLQSPLAATVSPGTTVRVTRRLRIDVYRASDGLWYLGARRCSAGSCAAVQPAAGPYAGGALPPMRVVAYARDGAALRGPSVTGIVRIDVAFAPPRSTDPRLPPTDSARVVVAARDVR